MESLTKDIVAKIFSTIPHSIGAIQSTSKYFQKLIDNDEWFEFLIFFLGFPVEKRLGSWKNIFKKYHNFVFDTTINTIGENIYVIAEYPNSKEFKSKQAPPNVELDRQIQTLDEKINDYYSRAHAVEVPVEEVHEIKEENKEIKEEKITTEKLEDESKIENERKEEMNIFKNVEENGIQNNNNSLQDQTDKEINENLANLFVKLDVNNINSNNDNNDNVDNNNNNINVDNNIVYEDDFDYYNEWNPYPNEAAYKEAKSKKAKSFYKKRFEIFITEHPQLFEEITNDLNEEIEKQFKNFKALEHKYEPITLENLMMLLTEKPRYTFWDHSDPVYFYHEAHYAIIQKLQNQMAQIPYDLDENGENNKPLFKEKENLIEKLALLRLADLYEDIEYTDEKMKIKSEIFKLEVQSSYLSCFSRQYNDITMAIIGCPIPVDIDCKLYIEVEIKLKGSEIFLGISSLKSDSPYGHISKVRGGDIIDLSRTWAITCGRRHCIQLDGKQYNNDHFKRFVVGDTVGIFLNFTQSKKEITFYVNYIQQGPTFEIDPDSLNKEVTFWTYADTDRDHIILTDVIWGNIPNKLICNYNWPLQTEQWTNFTGQTDWNTLNTPAHNMFSSNIRPRAISL